MSYFLLTNGYLDFLSVKRGIRNKKAEEAEEKSKLYKHTREKKKKKKKKKKKSSEFLQTLSFPLRLLRLSSASPPLYTHITNFYTQH